jgi:phage terminase small subunit
MPRKAASDFTTGTSAARLKPPADLDKPEAALFVSIVGAHPPERFTVADLPLLCAYCRACIDEEVASSELRAAGYVADGKVSPWLAIQTAAVRRVTTLCLALRLSPASRGPSSSEPDSISYYEKMNLLEHRDDPN